MAEGRASGGKGNDLADLSRRLAVAAIPELIAAEAELVGLVLAGERPAQHILLRHILGVVRAVLHRIPAADRADVEQEVLGRVFRRGLATWSPDRGVTLLGFVQTIASHERDRWLRKHWPRLATVVPWPEGHDPKGDGSTDGELLARWGREELVEQARMWFPNTSYAAATVQYLVDGVEPIEIASILRQREGTISAFLSRFRTHLRDAEKAHLEGNEDVMQGATPSPGRRGEAR